MCYYLIIYEITFNNYQKIIGYIKELEESVRMYESDSSINLIYFSTCSAIQV